VGWLSCRLLNEKALRLERFFYVLSAVLKPFMEELWLPQNP
jgi:hypothetical protein